MQVTLSMCGGNGGQGVAGREEYGHGVGEEVDDGLAGLVVIGGGGVFVVVKGVS